MHTSQTTYPLTKLHCVIVSVFDSYDGFWLPSNLEILSKIYKKFIHPKNLSGDLVDRICQGALLCAVTVLQ